MNPSPRHQRLWECSSEKGPFQQIVRESEIHPVHVSDWKQAMMEREPELLSSDWQKSPEEQY
ncbi:MAG: hypothetical protein ABGY95_02775 [Rubritalea sp.]|uniref:hypothetical protein n=1 Tax=Rubritalea sp. TaxID=2109375 RepID=UPI003241D6FA